MSPHPEQLIRDYLNRLSVAARGQLTAEDRRALVTRTHDFIERNANPSGPTAGRQIAVFLSRLGDPGELVEQEAARLQIERGEATPKAAPGRLASLLRVGAVRSSWHWPRAAGSPELQWMLVNGTASPEVADEDADDAEADDAEAGDAGPGDAEAGDTHADGVQPGETQADEVPAVAAQADEVQPGEAPAGEPVDYREPPIWVPRPRAPLEAELTTTPDEVAGPPESEPPADASPEPAAPARPSWPSVVARSGTPPGSGGPDGSGQDGAGHDTTSQWDAAAEAALPVPPPPLSVLMQNLVVLGARVLGWAKRHPHEAIAAVLLGLGGVIYPPVWLAGAVAVLTSKVWDYRDCWIGLAGPIMLLVVGTSAGVALGAHHANIGGYVHEGWMYADLLSRIGALAGTWYLVWRVTHPRRIPVIPPWTRPTRPGRP